MEDRQYRETGQDTTILYFTCRARKRRRDEVHSGVYVDVRGLHNLVFSLLFRLYEWGTGTFRHNYPIQLPTAVAVKLVF
jgi:hypothetical protein